MTIGNYVFNVLIAFDRLVNALIRGNPDETLSSVAYRKHRDHEPWGFMEGIINWLFRWQSPCHCLAAYNHDRTRKLPD